MKHWIAAALFLTLLPCARAEVVVVVAANSPIHKLDRQQVADIFLGRVRAWPSGATITPLELAETSPEYAQFHATVTEKPGFRIKAYWSRMVFAGKALPPAQLNTAAEIERALLANPNAIAFLDSRAVDSALRIIFP